MTWVGSKRKGVAKYNKYRQKDNPTLEVPFSRGTSISRDVTEIESPTYTLRVVYLLLQLLPLLSGVLAVIKGPKRLPGTGDGFDVWEGPSGVGSHGRWGSRVRGPERGFLLRSTSGLSDMESIKCRGGRRTGEVGAGVSLSAGVGGRGVTGGTGPAGGVGTGRQWLGTSRSSRTSVRASALL